jgi:hypothetical protein
MIAALHEWLFELAQSPLPVWQKFWVVRWARFLAVEGRARKWLSTAQYFEREWMDFGELGDSVCPPLLL